MLILVDMGHLYWLHYYATRNAIDAYTLTVDRIREYHDNCDRVAVCCDAPPLIRKAAYPEYKANREEKPPEALDALRAVEQQIETWNVPVVRVVGYEADDVIATLATQATGPVRIISNDKDLYSLIREDVFLVGKHESLTDHDGAVKKFGVTPAQMADYLALVGDASDNVPGCPGVGPGRARDLLVRFGTLDAVMAATDAQLSEVRGMGKKTLDSLRSWDPSLARSLVQLACDVPISLAELWPEEAPEAIPASPVASEADEFTIQW